MSDLRSSIKITSEEKKSTMEFILFNMIHSADVMSLYEVLQLKQQIKSVLNENEICATYNLGREIKISMSTSKRNEDLFEYLELNSYSVNNDKLLKFINEVVKDIEKTKKNMPKIPWSLQVNKILARLKGKDPANDEKFENENRYDVGKVSSESDIRRSKIIKVSNNQGEREE